MHNLPNYRVFSSFGEYILDRKILTKQLKSNNCILSIIFIQGFRDSEQSFVALIASVVVDVCSATRLPMCRNLLTLTISKVLIVAYSILEMHK